LSEIVKRLHPISDVRRRLFALSGNRCAFPKCPHPVINKNGKLVAEMCHIEAANVDGERFNPNQTNEQRRTFDNLILLCGTHHTITNDVDIYTVEKMRELKSSHEARSFTQTSEMQQYFVDATANKSYELPCNFKRLDINRWDDRSFSEANELLKRIATLPDLTRSLFVNALIYAVQSDLSLFVNPNELSIRLQESLETLDEHFAILVRSGLITEWSAEEAELAGRPPYRHFYLRGLDNEDYGNYFLVLLNRCFKAEPMILRDIIENLNFLLLDQ